MDLSACIQFSAECVTEFNGGNIFLNNNAEPQENAQHHSW